MTKQISALAIASFVALTLTACGGDHASPTGPSTTRDSTPVTAPPVDLSKKIYVRIARFVEGKLTVDVYGSLGYGLSATDRNRDLNGSDLRLRIFEDDSKFVTFIAGVYNSAPIANVNDTLLRDLPVYSKIDMTFTLQPYGCTNPPACWLKLTFPETATQEFLPSNQYALVPRAGETHVMGNIPAVQVASTTSAVESGFGPKINNGKYYLANEGYINPDGSVVYTKIYIE
jgi:hypothetical protein